MLYSSTALREAREWLDVVFGRSDTSPVASTGGPIVLLLIGIVILAWPLARALPRSDAVATALPTHMFLVAALVPAALTPVMLTFVDTRFLPVLVADYLTAHLLLYGAIVARLDDVVRREDRSDLLGLGARARRLRHLRVRRRARSLRRVVHAEYTQAADHSRDCDRRAALYARR